MPTPNSPNFVAFIFPPSKLLQLELNSFSPAIVVPSKEMGSTLEGGW